jgi:hypothetical protein
VEGDEGVGREDHAGSGLSEARERAAEAGRRIANGRKDLLYALDLVKAGFWREGECVLGHLCISWRVVRGLQVPADDRRVGARLTVKDVLGELDWRMKDGGILCKGIGDGVVRLGRWREGMIGLRAALERLEFFGPSFWGRYMEGVKDRTQLRTHFGKIRYFAVRGLPPEVTWDGLSSGDGRRAYVRPSEEVLRRWRRGCVRSVPDMYWSKVIAHEVVHNIIRQDISGCDGPRAAISCVSPVRNREQYIPFRRRRLAGDVGLLFDYYQSVVGVKMCGVRWTDGDEFDFERIYAYSMTRGRRVAWR